MAGVKISALPLLATPQLSDIYPTVQTGVTYRVSLGQLAALISNNPDVRLATTGALTATYDNGTAGVGATLTNGGALAALSIDSTSTVVGDRVLVKDQAATLQNGVYTVTVVGDAGTAWIMTRATDYDQPMEINQGDFFTIGTGTTNGKTQWIETAVVTLIGIDPVTFESNVVAGAGITKTNNVITSSGGGLTWSAVTTATKVIAVTNGYITNRGGGVAYSLPATSLLGDVFTIVGLSGIWSITQAAGQQINIGAGATTIGVGGSITAAAATDSAQFVCTVANLNWQVIGAPQSAGITIV